jgi:putative integral membrane protein (TIGR02587 family)
MPHSAQAGTAESDPKDVVRDFQRGLARAFAGAIIFGLPLLMTMEMWFLGFYMDPLRLAFFMIVMIPLLIGLSHLSGFKETLFWRDDAVDAMVAYGVGFAASALVLFLMNVIHFGMPLDEVVGKVALQAVPASFGAVIANSQLHGNKDEDANEEERRKQGGYGIELLLMATGAVFLAFNLAPTEEMILIAFMMSEWHAILLMLVSLLLMHTFVYEVDFRGQHGIPEGTPAWSIFLRFSVVGYAVCLGVSAYVLWTFGRFENTDLAMNLMMAVVLGFPATIGAAAARLIL